MRQVLLLTGIGPVIPPKSSRREQISSDYRTYKNRNRIERMFNKVNQFRRIATRYDKTKASFSAFLNLATPRLWLRDFINRI